MAAREPMVMQPGIALQNRRGIWLYKWPLRRYISDFFSSATKNLSRWDPPLKRLSSWIGPLAAISLQIRSILVAVRRQTKSLTKRTNLARRCCKCRTVIVRHAGLPCTPMTLTLGVCHAWGNLSGTDCSHCDSFSLSSAIADSFLFRERLRPSCPLIFFLPGTSAITNAIYPSLSVSYGSVY